MSKLNLLCEPSCASHDCCEEARVPNLPKLEREVDRRITNQVVTLGVEAETSYVFCVALQDLPLS